MAIRPRFVLLFLGLMLSGASAARAQEPSPDTRRTEATRQELQALLDQPGSKLSAAERQTIQTRLTSGDFQPGDRIRLAVLEEPTLTDTFTVRSNRSLLLPNIGEVSLDGVLRSELAGYLMQKITPYIRNAQVDASALVRIAVLGAVNRPGFYLVPAGIVISDVLMVAGGPTSNADLKKTIVRRGAEPVVDQQQMQQAMAEGVSLDQLNLHSGDEFFVADKSSGIKGALQTAGLISGIVFGIVALSKL